jgi:rhodanese-related sulfurtransferase
MSWKRTGLEALGLVAAAVVLATVSNAVASGKRHLRWVGEWTTGGAATPAAATTPAGPGATPAPAEFEIDSARAVAEHQAGTVFLDARRSEAFAEGHIPGAREFPVWESTTDDKIVDLLAELPPESSRVVVYCTGGRCEDSHLLRGKLLAAGYKDVLVYKDGMPGWEQAGQRVEK